jgi:hypothetical protein
VSSTSEEPKRLSCRVSQGGSIAASLRLPTTYHQRLTSNMLFRKEVIQPHLPIRLPCYDFTPIASPTVDGCILAVCPPASGVANSRGVTGGVYKARERIHRGMLIRDY